MKNYQKLKQIIIEANPEMGINRPIRYINVLSAIEKTEIYKSFVNGFIIGDSISFQWDLKHDSLDWHIKHRPETIKFLEDLLTK